MLSIFEELWQTFKRETELKFRLDHTIFCYKIKFMIFLNFLKSTQTLKKIECVTSSGIWINTFVISVYAIIQVIPPVCFLVFHA